MLRANSLALLLVIINACSYGFSSLKNPWAKQGINNVSVDIFENRTMEGGAEVYFTNSLREHLVARSRKLKLVRSNADAYIDGELSNVILRPAGVQMGTQATEDSGGLPRDRLLATSYILSATVRLTMKRTKDDSILWTNSFTQSRSMEAGRYTDQRRTSNVFIKESNKRETLRELADQIMIFAVDSLLEEF